MHERHLYGHPEARAFQSQHKVLDLHVDTLLFERLHRKVLRLPPLYYNLLRHRCGSWWPWWGHSDVQRQTEGLYGGQFWGLVSLPLLGERGCWRAVNEQISTLAALARANPERMGLAQSADDVLQLEREGRMAALMGIEGAHALEGRVNNVRWFAHRGVRYLGLAHFTRNRACRPAKGWGECHDEGLTPFGREVVEACEHEGVILDLNHLNARGFEEVVEMATKPLIVSHSGVQGATPHWGNVSDAQLRKIADSGGVIGIMFFASFFYGPGSIWGNRASIDDVVRHIAHAVNLVGEDHVAIGSDYDGMSSAPADLNGANKLPNLTEALLLRAKWPPERVAKILRGNVLRVLRDVPARYSVK